MGLKDLVIPSETIKVPGGEVTVRGLALPSVIFLLRTHGGPLQEVYAKARAGEFDAHTLAGSLFEESATLAGCIIACAAGEPDEFQKAMDLPAPTQIELLEAVGRMTFALEGGVKKFLGTIERMMGSLTSDSPST